jgi:L-fuculose-phosphate aldolase
MSHSPEQLLQMDRLIEVGRDIVRRELTKASAGNLSFRDPLDSSYFFVTGTGTWLDTLDYDSFARVAVDGSNSENKVAPSTEWKMHAKVYAVRPDAQVVLHAHPVYSVLLAAMAKEIRLFTLDHVSYVGSIGFSEFHPNGSDELADTTASEMLDNNCVIMQHHGCCVVDESVTKAYRRLLNLEDAAHASYLALAIGDTETRFPAGHKLSVHG